MRNLSIVRALAAAALIAVPSIALAAPDQNTYPNNYGCPPGQWNNNGVCVNRSNGQWNNGRWQNHDDRDHHDRDDRNRPNNYNNNYPYNNNYNNGYNNGYGRGGNDNYGRGNYGYSGTLNGTVSSFSPYNLYLNNGLHVELHDGTVINPTGTNLNPGMRVRVIGNRNGDGSFNANEIDVIGNGYRY
ncbi:MAG: hypothetical protein JOZ86_05685 [Candidatus Eremiobacteraeota bacterium]|nr:hypothetical protein [Candidatus Eremiobacteraeota bacterium]